LREPFLHDRGRRPQDQAARGAAERVADYEHGWSAEIETEFAPKGLNEDTVRFISAKKGRPAMDARLAAQRSATG
jgi:Fe-S cluster assembly protein SufB